MEKDYSYKLDKTLLTAMTFEEADDHITYWANKSESDRLDAACFIINQIFDVIPSDKINFAINDKRKHLNGKSV